MTSNTGSPAINRILYVDDEPALLDIGKVFLEEDGSFTVDTSHSALDALVRLSSRNYDAIVSDYQMPKMDGIAFLKTLRAQGDTTPFIIFTGRGREDVVIEALNSGADFYLQKGGEPVSQFTELAHKILHAISQKRAGLALKKSEQDYRHLIEHAGEGIFIIQDERFRMINPRAAELSGYSEQELLNQPFVRFVHPDEGDMLLDKFRNRDVAATVPTHYTFRTICKDTTVRWVELNVVAITWDERPATLNFMIDVTDRKLAEDALKESGERYRHLIEHAGEGIYVVQDGKLQMVNSRTTEMCGYTEEELLSQPFKNFVHPDDFNMLIDRFRKRISGETVPSRYSYRISRKDGTLRWVELSVVIIDWNGAPATLNYVTDITDRKLAEDALKESEERYREFFRTSLDCVFITSPAGDWIDFNDATVKMFGGSNREEIAQKNVHSFYVNPEERAPLFRNIEGIGFIKEAPLQLKKLDGTIFDAVVTSVPLKNPDGSTKAITGTIRDITEIKMAVDALKESEERYRQVFRTTLDGLFITTLEGDWIDFNDAVIGMFGCRSRNEVFSIPIRDFYVDPEDREAIVQRTLREGYIKEYPLKYKRLDGTTFDALMTVVAWKNPDGSTRCFIGTISDVTEKKRTEDALRESEERYRQFFKTTLDGLFITARDGRWIDFNDAIVDLLGYPNREDLFSVPITSVYVRPEERDTFIEQVERDGYVREYPVQLKKRDGSLIHGLMTVALQRSPDGSTKAIIGTIRDVTEKKRTEDALRESEEMYRLFFKTSQDSVFIVGTNGRYIDFNDYLFQRLGCNSREEAMALDTVSTYANVEERGPFLELVQRNGFVKEYPITFRKRDGTAFDTLITIIARKNPDGSTKAYFGTIRDITERKRAEKALRESEERYRMITGLITDFIWDWDTRTGSVQWFGDIDTALGYAQGEFPRTFEAWERSVHPDDHDRIISAIHRSLETGERFDVEYRMLARDGTCRHFHDRGTTIADAEGTSARMIGAVTDITERRNIEESLRESEERYRRIFESFEDLYYQTDTNGIITILSPSLNRLTGWTEKELIGSSITKIYINPEDRQVLLNELAKNGYVRDYEVLLQKQDGTETPVSLSANRIFHPDGTPAGVAGIIRDITRRKRAEDALKESEVKFRSLVDHALEAIMITDMQGKVLFCNNAAARTVDAENGEDLIGRNVMEVIAPESRGDVVKDFEEVARGHDAYVARYHLISLKGRDVFVESIGKVLTYEGKPADLISLRDVTGQMK